MTISPSKVRFGVDALLQLRGEAAAAITATAASAALPLDRLGAPWNDGELAVPQQFAVFGSVQSLDVSSADETYVLQLQVSANEAFSAPVVVSSHPVTKGGIFVIGLVREDIKAKLDTAAFFRINAVLAGTTPSLDYYAYAAPYQG